ncbi:GNAT family N-acetyltransferase [Pelagibacterium halotolerans]|uniref:Putative acetyltransferase, GNAT family n=1 Tax=Pelagibacterium halotolerans (strain DSM 22347 / JCM 15775 / CGMCC 1.7692 / B2) TaxID=1082931 RepID=G4RG67_PELHB|nr:GNAT family N-acetyltransferase [Pelagibacterium halotolerans]AEQ53043.1 putative acetyltransferase, GNAT family [Pelagibacterium halotolerans B2]QJR17303.1 GNAT family N-acetyltransferase [Pelagibacterium halotolerans]SEA86662.1 Acetyltransferase (GNAT) domain-containing protein [Pelagibacterium halotolerans]
MSAISIRPALAGDAEEAAALLRRSIIELCVPDHGNNAERLEHWLSNKTAEHFVKWIDDPLNMIFVAFIKGRMASAGGLREVDGIVLNYVHPESRFMGVSGAMMVHLEEMLRGRGEPVANLVSTITARRFYEARGYRERDLLPEQRPLYGIAMEKRL